MHLPLVVVDLDSTLLKTDKSLSEKTVDVLHAYQKAGGLVAFATARTEVASIRFSEIIGPDAIISNSGARARIGEKTVYRATIDPETTSNLLRVLADLPGVGYISADTDLNYFLNKPIAPQDRSWLEYRPVHHPDLNQGLPYDCYKITVEIADHEQVLAACTPFPSVEVGRYSGAGWVRISDREANKANAVRALANHLGMTLRDVVAFGDDYSDIEMIRHCGLGVAVANAIAEVKAVADHVCASNDEDGVARWLATRFNLGI